MKKFMKAIAFVTVMCMALSTVAFAANEVPETANADKTFVVTVREAGTSDQVALMVVEAGATKEANRDFSNPLYIDQKGANSGVAEFTAKIAEDVTAVDVFVGYANNQDPQAVYVGRVSLEQSVTKVTVTNVNVEWANYPSDDGNATGAVLSFNFEVPVGVSSTQMGWQITYLNPEDETKTVTKKSDVFDISAYSLGGVIQSGSNVKFGLVFLNGSEENDGEAVQIVDIQARFLFKGDALASGSQYVFAADSEPNQ